MKNDEKSRAISSKISFAVEKGSPGDKVLQVFQHHRFDAEITGIEVKCGGPGKHQLVKVDGRDLRRAGGIVLHGVGDHPAGGHGVPARCPGTRRDRGPPLAAVVRVAPERRAGSRGWDGKGGVPVIALLVFKWFTGRLTAVNALER